MHLVHATPSILTSDYCLVILGHLHPHGGMAVKTCTRTDGDRPNRWDIKKPVRPETPFSYFGQLFLYMCVDRSPLCALVWLAPIHVRRLAK